MHRPPMPPPIYRKGSVQELEYHHLEIKREWDEADDARFARFLFWAMAIACVVFMGAMINLTGFPN